VAGRLAVNHMTPHGVYLTPSHSALPHTTMFAPQPFFHRAVATRCPRLTSSTACTFTSARSYIYLLFADIYWRNERRLCHTHYAQHLDAYTPPPRTHCLPTTYRAGAALPVALHLPLCRSASYPLHTPTPVHYPPACYLQLYDIPFTIYRVYLAHMRLHTIHLFTLHILASPLHMYIPHGNLGAGFLHKRACHGRQPCGCGSGIRRVASEQAHHTWAGQQTGDYQAGRVIPY